MNNVVTLVLVIVGVLLAINFLIDPQRMINRFLGFLDYFTPGSINIPRVIIDENHWFHTPKNLFFILLPRIEEQEDWHLAKTPSTPLGRLFSKYIKEYHTPQGHVTTIFGYEFERLETMALLSAMIIFALFLDVDHQIVEFFKHFQHDHVQILGIDLSGHVVLGIVLIPFFLRAFQESWNVLNGMWKDRNIALLIGMGAVTVLGIFLPFRAGQLLVSDPMGIDPAFGLTVIATDIAFSSVIARITGIPRLLVIMLLNASFWDDFFGIVAILFITTGAIPVGPLLLWVSVFVVTVVLERRLYKKEGETKSAIYLGTLLGLGAMFACYMAFRTLHVETVMSGVLAWVFATPLTKDRLWYWLQTICTIPALFIFAAITSVPLSIFFNLPTEEFEIMARAFASIVSGKVPAYWIVLVPLVYFGFAKKVTIRDIGNVSLAAALGYKFMAFNSIALQNVITAEVTHSMVTLSNVTFPLIVFLVLVWNLPFILWQRRYIFSQINGNGKSTI